jgi:1-acyl-sn-glycerol-3-phosphate acyltransferase
VIRTVWVLVAGGILTFTMSGILFVSNLLRRPGLPGQCERLGRLWAQGVLRLAGTRVRFQGPDREQWPPGAVIVANHQSWFDVFALAARLPITYRFVAKEELSRIPVFGTAWQACGHVSLDRDDRGQAINTLNRAGAQLRGDGSAIILFPEGTRSPDGRVRGFKKGAFVLAIHSRVPVVPVGISGSAKVMPKGSFRIRPGEIRIRVGDPISTEGLRHRDRGELLERARQAVLRLTEHPDALEGPEETPGAPQETPEDARGRAGPEDPDEAEETTA